MLCYTDIGFNWIILSISMARRICILFALLFGFTLTAQAQLSQFQALHVSAANEGLAAVTTNAAGDLIAAGVTDEGGTSDIFVTRIDNNAQTTFTQRYDFAGAQDTAFGIVTMANGSYTIAGHSWNGTNQALVVFNIDAAGTVNWTYTYDNFRLGTDPLLLTANDEVVIAGFGLDDNGCGGIGCRDFAAIRLDNTGTEVFNVQHNVVQDGQDQANAAIEVGTRILLVGTSNPTSIIGTGGTILEIDPATGAAINDAEVYRNAAGTAVEFQSGVVRADQPNNLIIVARHPRFAGATEGIIFDVNTVSYNPITSSTYGFAPDDLIQTRVVNTGPNDYVTVNAVSTGGTEYLQVNGFTRGGASFGAAGNNRLDEIENANLLGATVTAGGEVVAAGLGSEDGSSDDGFLAKFNTTLGTSCNAIADAADVSGQPLLNQPEAVAVATPVGGAIGNTAPTPSGAGGFAVNPCCVGYNVSVTADPVCEDDNVTLVPAIALPGDTEFEWYLSQAPPVTGGPDAVTTGSYINTFPVGFQDFTLVAIDSITGCTDSLYDSVEVVAPPLINLPNDDEICFGDTIDINGFATSNDLQWSVTAGDVGSVVGSSTNPTLSVSPNSTSDYELEAEDENVTGCINRDTIRITVNSLPPVDAGSDVTICLGDNTSLTASGANTYTWTPTNGLSATTGANVTASPTQSTTYAVEGTDVNSCVATDTVIVAVVNASLGGISDTSFCTNTAGTTLDGTIVGATVPCTYTWSPNTGIVSGTINDPIIQVAPAAVTDYQLAVDCDGGVCLDTAEIKVTPNTPPVADPGTDTTICEGDTVNLTASGGDAYDWSPAAEIQGPTDQAQIVIAPSALQTYQVIATDQTTFCRDTATVDVDVNPIPVFSLGIDETVCEDEQVINHPAPPGFPQYAWQPTSELLNPANANTNDPVLTPNATTDYFATVTDAAGCSYTDTLTLTVIPSPQGFINGEFVSDTTICDLDSITLIGSGGTDNRWLPPVPNNAASQTAVTVSPNDTTAYRYVAIDNGCFGTDGDTATITVNVDSRPDPNFTVPVDGCVDDPLVVYWVGNFSPDSVNSYDSLSWSFDTACVVNYLNAPGELRDSVELTYCDSGIKIVSMTNTGPYCASTEFNQILIRENPIIDAGNDIEICEGQSDTLDGSFVFRDTTASCAIEWTPYNGLSNPFSLNPVASPMADETYYLQANCGGCISNLDSVTVNVQEPPTSSIDTFLLEFCDGTGGVVLPGNGDGGSGNYNYLWTNSGSLTPTNSPTPTANPTNNTLYQLRVEDVITGCVSDESFIQVNVLPQPVVYAGPDKDICDGTNQGTTLDGQVTQNGFGLTEVTWSPAATLSDENSLTPYATPTTTTTYSLYVINQYSGCDNSTTITDDSSTVTVFVNPRPVADAGPDSVFTCLGQGVQIGGNPSGGGPNYSYTWTPAANLSATDVQFPTASPSQNTTYFLKVSSNGCESEADSIVVAVDDAPVFSMDFPYVRICEDRSVVIGTDPKPGFTYTWTPEAGLNESDKANPSAAPDVSTTYTLAVNANGCTATATDTVRVEVVPSPEPIVPEDYYVLCPDQQDSVQLTIDGVDTDETPILYSWSPNIAISDTMAQSPNVLPEESTTYTLTTYAGQCIDSAKIEVFVNPPIGAEILLDEGVDTAVCDFETVRLTATGGVGSAIYRWLDTQSINPQRDVQPSTTTTYAVEVRESGICRDTASITLEVFPQVRGDLEFTYNIGCDDSLNGMPVVFRATDPNASFYSWDFGDGSPVSNAQEPTHIYDVPNGADTSYTVRLYVAGVGACDETVIEEDLILTGVRPEARFVSVPEVPATVYLPQGDVFFQNLSTNGVNYFWRFGDGQTSREESPTHDYEVPGQYDVTLTVTDDNGCTDTYTSGPYKVEGEVLELPTVFTPNEDGVNDRWLTGYTGTKPYELNIFDRSGRNVYSVTQNNDQGWDGTFDNAGEPMPTGVYFYVLDLDGKIYKGNITLVR